MGLHQCCKCNCSFSLGKSFCTLTYTIIFSPWKMTPPPILQQWTAPWYHHFQCRTSWWHQDLRPPEHGGGCGDLEERVSKSSFLCPLDLNKQVQCHWKKGSFLDLPKLGFRCRWRTRNVQLCVFLIVRSACVQGQLVGTQDGVNVHKDQEKWHHYYLVN